MGCEVVSLPNVIFELYKAALAGEITQDEFVKVKRIVKRARVIEDDEVKAWLNGGESDAFREAKKLMAGSDACAAAIDEYARKIKNLNSRVCDMMEG